MCSTRPSVWHFGALSASLSAGYGVLFTVVGDFRDEYGIGDSAVGLIIGVGFLAAFVAQVFLAPIADRGRARQVVVAGAGVNALGLVLMAVGGSLWPVLAGRIVSGLGIGAAVPAIRRIVVLSDRANVGRNLGLLLSADVFGFAAGPALSALLVGPLGLSAPFLVVAVASVALIVPTRGVALTDTVEPSRQRFAVDLLRLRPVAGAVALGTGGFVLIGTFDALWDVVHEDLGTSTWMANLGITLFAVPLFVLGPVGGTLAQRIGPYLLAAGGLFVAAGFMLSYGFVPTGSWIFGLSLVHSVSDGLTFPAAGVAISLAVPEDRQAGAQGIMGAVQALFAGATAIFIGSVYDHGGRAWAYGVGAVGMVVFAVSGLLLAAPVVGRLRSPTRAAATAVGAP